MLKSPVRKTGKPPEYWSMAQEYLKIGIGVVNET